MIKNKKILVTGGAGFVGSALVKRLKEQNRVSVLDNYFTGSKKNHLSGVRYFKAETKDIFNFFKNFKLDYIFHLGEYSRVEQSFDDFDKIIKFNAIPIFEVLKLAKSKNAKLIYSGSSTKFAKKNKLYLESPYAWSKISNTNLINAYAKWYGLDYVITYFYNVYGPGEISEGKYSTVIAKFLKISKGSSNYLPVSRPGTQKRNFTHIDDIIEGLILVAKKGKGDGYGIGSEKSYSIVDIVKILGKKPKYYVSNKGNRMSATVKSNLTKKLGWRAKISLEAYLKEN